jgi:hypothetical protein
MDKHALATFAHARTGMAGSSSMVQIQTARSIACLILALYFSYPDACVQQYALRLSQSTANYTWSLTNNAANGLNAARLYLNN